MVGGYCGMVCPDYTSSVAQVFRAHGNLANISSMHSLNHLVVNI
jgi:hypothetical protein